MIGKKLHILLLKNITYNPYRLIQKENSYVNFAEIFNLEKDMPLSLPQGSYHRQDILKKTIQEQLVQEQEDNTVTSILTGNKELLIFLIVIFLVIVCIFTAMTVWLSI